MARKRAKGQTGKCAILVMLPALWASVLAHLTLDDIYRMNGVCKEISIHVGALVGSGQTRWMIRMLSERLCYTPEDGPGFATRAFKVALQASRAVWSGSSLIRALFSDQRDELDPVRSHQTAAFCSIDSATLRISRQTGISTFRVSTLLEMLRGMHARAVLEESSVSKRTRSSQASSSSFGLHQRDSCGSSTSACAEKKSIEKRTRSGYALRPAHSTSRNSTPLRRSTPTPNHSARTLQRHILALERAMHLRETCFLWRDFDYDIYVPAKSLDSRMWSAVDSYVEARCPLTLRVYHKEFWNVRAYAGVRCEAPSGCVQCPAHASLRVQPTAGEKDCRPRWSMTYEDHASAYPQSLNIVGRRVYRFPMFKVDVIYVDCDDAAAIVPLLKRSFDLGVCKNAFDGKRLLMFAGTCLRERAMRAPDDAPHPGSRKRTERAKKYERRGFRDAVASGPTYVDARLHDTCATTTQPSPAEAEPLRV